MMEWLKLYLLKFPDNQEKIHQEISQLTDGNTRPICLTDRANTHYLNAFIDEVGRHWPVLVTAAVSLHQGGHRTERDQDTKETRR